MRLEAPTSKSMTQRALVIAALADHDSVIERPLWCDDSRYLSDLLRALGCEVVWAEDQSQVRVEPAPLTAPERPIFCGNAGTAVRFGACLGLVCQGALTIDGDERMRSRPLGALGQSLESLGARVGYLNKAGCPPIVVERAAALARARVAVDTTLSSQYASGLLLAAPRLPGGLVVELTGSLVSMPYIEMTLGMMRQAGARVSASERLIEVEPGGYRGPGGRLRLAIEPDWSAAAFLLSAARFAAIDITIPGLLDAGDSLQGDAVFAAMLRSLAGEPEGGLYRFDLTDAPDLIAPLAVAALAAEHPTVIHGVAHARVKESDRVAVLARELGRLGATVSARDDGLELAPLDVSESARRTQGGIALDPDDDHRMAMAFGVLSLLVPTIEVKNPECVSKSFPGFWDTLNAIRTVKATSCR
jgi:3-phosphoshikimate 1-carboxyvinyltransferase